MQYGISDPPDQMNRNIVYDIVCDIAYDMKPKTYDVLVKMYDVAYDVQHTMSYVNLRHRTLHTISYVRHTISKVAISYVPMLRCRMSTSYVQTYDIVRLRHRTSKPTTSYVYVGIIRCRTSDLRCRRLARIQMSSSPISE